MDTYRNDVTAQGSALVLTAQDLFYRLLGAYDARVRHTVGVVRQAMGVVRTVDPGDADLLLAAAWLHDIGCARLAQDSGFHPLDGALLLQRYGWLERLCGFVAFHAGAYFLAADLGLGPALRAFRDEPGAVRDALTYADQTVGPYGERLPVEHRLDESLRRHGRHSPHARVHAERAPYVRSAVERVHQRMAI